MFGLRTELREAVRRDVQRARCSQTSGGGTQTSKVSFEHHQDTGTCAADG
jgi:hypothetical protein